MTNVVRENLPLWLDPVSSLNTTRKCLRNRLQRYDGTTWVKKLLCRQQHTVTGFHLHATLLYGRPRGVVASVYMLITSTQSCGMLTSVVLAICDGCFTARCSPGGR